MSRRIRTVSLQAADGGSVDPPDSYTDRIVKLIPSDVVAAWLAATTAIKAHGGWPERKLWITFGIGLVFAALWTWKKASKTGEPPPYIQTAVSTVAFFIWAYAMGGLAPEWPGGIYDSLTATLMLIGFSLLSGLVTKP